MINPTANNKSDLSVYEAVLREANEIRGVSLGKDAWRRLRKSYVSMISLCGLCLLGLLAFFTPLLPLQSPRETHTTLKYARPTVEPLMIRTEWFSEDVLKEQTTDIDLAEKAIARASEQLEKLRAEKRPTSETERKAYDQRMEAAEQTLEQRYAQYHDAVQLPYTRANLGQLNLLDRAMVRLRWKLFGTLQVNSICGRDNLGRDLLSRICWGGRVSLIVGIVATLVSLIIGVSYGAISGYLGGLVDDVMMRAVDVFYSIPFIFVVIFLLSLMNDSEFKAEYLEPYGIDRMKVFFVVVGAIYWLTMARVVRGQVITLKNEQFVDAARTVGANKPQIIFLHIVPNLFSVIIVYLTLTIPSVMLFEAFLSFLGLGVEPPNVSWGVLAKEGIAVITPVKIYWWLVLFPGIAFGATLFALNYLGDGLRDALDPRMKNK